MQPNGDLRAHGENSRLFGGIYVQSPPSAPDQYHEFYSLPIALRRGSFGRFGNLSSRAVTEAGGNALIVGFVLDGDTAEEVLVRAAGPSLADYGVQGRSPG